jgi:uncharacterized membrane protein
MSTEGERVCRSSARLLRASGALSGQEVALGRDYLIIGREPAACHILLEEDVVSRRHAALELDALGGATVVDLASSNGTFVNGVRIARRVLNDGDRIGFGPGGEVEFIYRAAAPETNAAHGNPAEGRSEGLDLTALPSLPSLPSPPSPAFTAPVSFPWPPESLSGSPAPETVCLDGETEGSLMQKVCATCSTVLDHDAAFCPSCRAAASAPSTIVCPQCGKSIGAGSKFCKYCAFGLAGAGARAAEQSLPYNAPPPGPPPSIDTQPFNAPPLAAATTFVEPNPPGVAPTQPLTGGAPFDGTSSPAGFNDASSYGTPASFSQPSTYAGPSSTFNQPPSPYSPTSSSEGFTFGDRPSQATLTPQYGSAAPHALAASAQAADAAGTTADKGSFITPAGGAIVVICFFLPWVQFSCGGYVRTVSGVEMANGDGSLWLVFCAAVVILGAYFAFKVQGRVARSRPLVIISALIGLCLMAFKSYGFVAGEQTMFGRISPRDLGISPQLGVLGTFVGFLLSLVGTAAMRSAPRGYGARQATLPPSAPALWHAGPPPDASLMNLTPGGTQPTLLDRLRRCPPKIAAALCYVTFTFFSMFMIWTLIAIALLLVEPYKQNRFVRFHAFQTLLYGVLLFALQFVIFVLGLQRITELMLLLFLANFCLSVFLTYKAYVGEAFKLPVLGDMAASLAERQTAGTPPGH